MATPIKAINLSPVLEQSIEKFGTISTEKMRSPTSSGNTGSNHITSSERKILAKKSIYSRYFSEMEGMDANRRSPNVEERSPP